MIVASTPTTASAPTAVPTDTASGTGETRDPAQEGAGDGGVTAAFGKKLERAIGRPVAGHDAKTDAQQVDPAGEAAAGVVMAIPTELIVCGAAVPAPDDADATDRTKGDAGSADAGADLAAQLALVSQWAGVAQVPASPTTGRIVDTTDTRDDTQRAANIDALGISDKLAVLRGDVAHTTVTKDARTAVTKADAALRDIERLPTTAAATPALAASLLASGPLKEAVERTVAALDAGTPTTSTAALAASLLHAAAGSTDTSTTAPTALREAVGTAAWTEEFGRAAVHVATTSLKEASLRLNPEHLGPLDVRVRIDGGVAHLAFQASHADTRHALEASRPALDQMFSNQGLSIGDYSVDDRASSRHSAATADGSGGGSGRDRGASGRSSGSDDALDRAIATRLSKPLGLVDTFA